MLQFNRFLWLLLLPSVLGLTGVAQDKPAEIKQPTAPKKVYAAEELAKVWQTDGWKFPAGFAPVTDGDAVNQWGKSFGQSAKDGDATALAQAIDFKPLFDRAVDGFSNKEFQTGFRNGIQTGAGQLLARFVQAGTTYHFLGVRDSEFGPGALFRLVDENGGCNYHLWRLQHDPLGKIKGIDMYIFLSGESFGDTMRRMALIVVPQGDPTLVNRLPGKDSLLAANQAELLQLFQQSQLQNFEGVLDSYEKLPLELKHNKSIMMIRMMAAMRFNVDEYFVALEEYHTQFPDDPSADLASIDLYYLREEYDAMLGCIQRLEKNIGPDAQLLLLKSAALAAQKRLDDARRTIETAIQLEPDFANAYWKRVEYCLQQNDFNAVNESLKILCEKFGFREFDFAAEPMYDAYLKSQQHEAFLAYLETLKSDSE